MHESTTHVNRFVFDSVFSKEKTSFACSMLTVSASRNVLVKLLQFVPQKSELAKKGRGYRRGKTAACNGEHMKYVNGAFTLVNAKQSKEPVFPS